MNQSPQMAEKIKVHKAKGLIFNTAGRMQQAYGPPALECGLSLK